MLTDLPVGSLLLLVPLLAVVLLPGFGLASWLHRRDRFHWTFRCALGFAYSVALFGLLSWPFLWFGGQFRHLLWLLCPVWAVYSLIGGYCLFQAWREPEVAADAPPVGDGAATPGPAVPSRQGRGAAVVFLGCVGLAALGALAWARLAPEHYEKFMATAAVAVVALAVLLWRWRRTAAPLLRFNAVDHAPPPAPWWALAVGLVVVQAASAVVYDRPDWDDGYYLGAMLDYQHAPRLNDQEPLHREGFPVDLLQRALCWELGGAVLCRLTGLTPPVLFHTALPGLVVLLAYAAYAGLLRECLPRRWVPLALVGLVAVHTWGISGNYTAIGYLLPRPCQGKTVLAHLAVPLCACLLIRATARPGAAVAGSLLAAVVFGLTVSLSGIFLLFMLVVCLAAALAVHDRSLSPRRLWPAAVALVPVLAAGLALRHALHIPAAGGGDGGGGGAGGASAAGSAVGPVLNWFAVLRQAYAGDGSAEVVWFLTLPLLAVLVGRHRGAAYLVVFPLVLGLTFGNPLLRDLVAAHLTSTATYFRHWWLYPVGPGLAVLLALGARFLVIGLGRARSAWWPLGAAAAGLAASWLLPGLYVWGPRNNYIGPLAAPHLAENAEKMPAGLLAAARRLEAGPDVGESRILCDLQAAAFLAPYSRDFRFVHTRWLATAPLFAGTGRPREALERVILEQVLLHDRVPDRFPPPLPEVRAFASPEVADLISSAGVCAEPLPDLPALLARYRVKYVITGPGTGAGTVFARCGYRVVVDEGGIRLWRAACTGEGGPDAAGADTGRG